MANQPNQEAVVEAARALGSEFTRDDVAEKLGVERQKMRNGWRAAKQAGQIEKIGENADGTNLFKVAST